MNLRTLDENHKNNSATTLKTRENKNSLKETSEQEIIKKDKIPSANIHKNHRARLKGQFLSSGIEALSDVQKLEMLLFFAIPQKDTNPISHALLDHFGSLKDVLLADYNDLIQVDGVKENSATLITFFKALFHYSNMPDLNETLSSTEVAKEYCKQLFSASDVEEFYVLILNKANKVKKYKLIQSGTQDEINLQIRSITKFAIESKSNRIVVCHNHPAGAGTMSDEDCSFTYSLLCSCLLNSIDVLDHIIVGTDKTISLCEYHVMDRLRKKAVSSIQLPKEKQIFISSLSENYLISNSYPEPKINI